MLQVSIVWTKYIDNWLIIYFLSNGVILVGLAVVHHWIFNLFRFLCSVGWSDFTMLAWPCSLGACSVFFFPWVFTAQTVNWLIEKTICRLSCYHENANESKLCDIVYRFTESMMRFADAAQGYLLKLLVILGRQFKSAKVAVMEQKEK